MFKKLKEAVVGKEPSDTNKTIKPKDDKRVFAGMTVKQIEQEKLKQDNVLTSPVISSDVQNSVNQVKEKIRNLRRDRFMSYSFNKILQLL